MLCVYVYDEHTWQDKTMVLTSHAENTISLKFYIYLPVIKRLHICMDGKKVNTTIANQYTQIDVDW